MRPTKPRVNAPEVTFEQDLETTIKNKVTDQNGLNEETISNLTHVYFIPLYSFPRHVCSQLTLHRFINEQHFNM